MINEAITFVATAHLSF